MCYNCQFHGARGSVCPGCIRAPTLIGRPAGLDGGHIFCPMVRFGSWLPAPLPATASAEGSPVKIDGVNVLPGLRGEGGSVETRGIRQWNCHRPEVIGNAGGRDSAWKWARPAIHGAMHGADIDWPWASTHGPAFFVQNVVLC
jgi:hypothetical protein